MPAKMSITYEVVREQTWSVLMYLVEDANTVEGVLRLYFRVVIRVHGRFRHLELPKVFPRASRLHVISPTKRAGM